MIRARRMLSKWAIPLTTVTMALMASSSVHALGLGEARVESFLNQPLDVRMRLLDVSEDDLDSLSVTQASPEDFERLGLMSESLALGLQIEVDRSVSPPIVRVTSARPVSDPVIQLLLDARWGSGRMLREYTLFLDPPTVAIEAPAPAPARQASRPAAIGGDTRDNNRAETAPARPAPDRPDEQRAGPRSRAVAASGDRSYGPVESGDTLWSIASANLPVGDVTMNQMMIAIVDLNPKAFRDGNINQLLRGARLQLPAAEQAGALDEAAAAAEVIAQHRAFRRRVASDVPVVSSAGRDSAPAADIAARPEEAESEATADHRLSLVPPGEEQSGNGLSEGATEVADLRQRLARAEEELFAVRREAEEFQSRVEELETLIRQNPGGIGLRDAELAGLEATLRAAREATRADADPQLRSEVSERLEGYLEQYEAASQDSDGEQQLASSESDPDTGMADDVQAGAGPDPARADPPAEADATAGSDASTVPERSATEVQDSRGLMSNPVLLAVVGLVVLLVILAIIMFALRRGRESAGSKAPPKPAADPPRSEPSAEDPVRAARARVTANPDDLAAHLDLLQTLATDSDQDEFGQALEAMYGHVDSDSQPEWSEALELAGRIVPGHSLVKGSSDWAVESSDIDSGEPVSEVDEETEVDDLMTRLDEDLDEPDDLEWLGEEGGDGSEEDDAPFLRDDDDDETDIEDTLVLDWAEEDKPEAQAEPGSSSEHDDPGAASEDGQAEDDIFAQSDDDIDVKLDLAKAYLSWNSSDSARTLLEEVAREGNDAQREEARTLLDDLSDGSED